MIYVPEPRVFKQLSLLQAVHPPDICALEAMGDCFVCVAPRHQSGTNGKFPFLLHNAFIIIMAGDGWKTWVVSKRSKQHPPKEKMRLNRWESKPWGKMRTLNACIKDGPASEQNKRSIAWRIYGDFPSGSRSPNLEGDFGSESAYNWCSVLINTQKGAPELAFRMVCRRLALAQLEIGRHMDCTFII